MRENRKCFALCNYADRYAFISGGLASQSFLGSVERYDLTNDEWEEMPSLNVARIRHASCALGDAVYVFCG